MRWAGRDPITARRFLAASLVVALGAALCVAALPANHAQAATTSLYVRGSSIPKAGLLGSAPTSGTLPNFDPKRDSFPGLLLQKSGSGLTESDSNKYQIWVSSNGGLQIQGQVSFRFWSAMKDFNDDKAGVVEAFLLECTPGGTNCVLIDQGSAAVSPWNSSQTWVVRTIDFGSIDHTIPANRSLALKIVVGSASGDDMWFAYDTASYPSSLTVDMANPTTTTSTTAPTTSTTAPPTTSTTGPQLTTTTTAHSGTGSTVTTIESTTTTLLDDEISTTTVAAGGGTSGRGSGGAGGPGSDEGGPGIRPGQSADTPDSAEVTVAGEDPVVIAAADPAMGAIAGGSPVVEWSTLDQSWAGSIISGLDLVMPPWVTDFVTSPLMVFGFVFAAVTDSGQAILLPMSLLLVGTLWVLFENRAFTLTVVRRSRGEGGIGE